MGWGGQDGWVDEEGGGGVEGLVGGWWWEGVVFVVGQIGNVGKVVC